MAKKVSSFVVQMVVCYILYLGCMWLFNAIFDREYGIDTGMLIQALGFTIIFVPLSCLWTKRRQKEK